MSTDLGIVSVWQLRCLFRGSWKFKARQSHNSPDDQASVVFMRSIESFHSGSVRRKFYAWVLFSRTCMEKAEMKALLMAVATVILNVSLMPAQVPSECQNLKYFAGTWTVEVHLKAASLGGKVFFGTEHNEWLPGQSLLLSRQDETSPLGSNGISIMGYNSHAKAYTYHQVKSDGEAEDLRGTFSEGTWTWTRGEIGNGEQRTRTRLIMKEVSATSYILKLENETEGHEWITLLEGKATKVLPRTHGDVAFLR